MMAEKTANLNMIQTRAISPKKNEAVVEGVLAAQLP